MELVSIPDDGAGDGERVFVGLSSCLIESTLLHFLRRGYLAGLGVGKLPPINNLFTSVSTDKGKTEINYYLI